MDDLHEKTEKKKAPDHPVLIWSRRIAWTIFILLASLFVLLQFSAVQTYISSRITAYLSDVTQTQVTAERLKISPFDGIVLQNLRVVDARKDTLVQVGAFTVSFRKNLFYLFNNSLDLSYFGLKDLRVNVITEKDSTSSNLTHFIDKLPIKKTSSKPSTPFQLHVRDIELSDIQITIHNKNKGAIQKLSLKSGMIVIDSMSLPEKSFYIASALLHAPSFYNHTYGENFSIATNDKKIRAVTPARQGNASLDPIVTIGEFAVKDGWYGTSNALISAVESPWNSLDYNQFFFEKINVGIRNLSFRNGNEFTAAIDILNAKDNKGLEIKNVSCRQVQVSPNSTVLSGLDLRVGNTVIQDRIRLNYPGWKSFNQFAEKVVLNCDFDNSRIYLGDIVHFASSLGKLPVIQNNITETLDVSGHYFGVINHLSGNDVFLRLGTKMSLAGSFKVNDLLHASKAHFNVRMDQFTTSLSSVRSIIPTFRPPDNFYKLGKIQFSGRFNGYLEDFTAYGYMKSALGDVEMNMNLNIREGAEKAKYAGTLNLRRFNLGWWSDNTDLGFVNFNSTVQEGKGLTLASARANVKAAVKSLTFKKYEYKDFILDGKLDKNTFNGRFSIDDENASFVFLGTFEYLQGQAFLDFTADIKRLDLKALNLSKTSFSASAKMDVRISGTSLSDFTGNVGFRDVKLAVKDSTYQIDRVDINSRLSVRGTQVVNIESDLGLIQLDGKYDLPGLPASMRQILKNNYPYLTRQWKMADKLAKDQRFDFTIALSDSRNFLSLLGLQNSHFSSLSVKGRVDTYKNEISVATVIPFIQLNKDSIQDIQFIVSTKQSVGDVLLHIDSTFALGRHFNPIDVQSSTVGDTVLFDLSTENLIDTLENFNIKGRLIPHERGYSVSVTDNLIELLGTKWSIHPLNQIIFGKEFLRLENLFISDGYRSVELNDINLNKGLSLDVTNFDVNVINAFIDFKKMYFAGPMALSAQVSDLFSDDREVAAYLSIPSLTINKKPYGSVYLDVGKKLGKPYQASFTVGDFVSTRAVLDDKAKTIDARIKLREAPLELLEYILKDGIRKTGGGVNGSFTLTGPLSQPILEGQGTVVKGTTTVIYTGASYYFDNQTFSLTNTTINLDGARITDQNGNEGIIKGGLTHKLFKSFGVKASLSGNNVVGLSTTKADNPAYYGYGIGRITAEFNGPVDALDLRITAVTGPGTKLFIPIKDSQSAISQSFIRFVKKEGKNGVSIRKPYTLKGMDIEMAITLTPDAEVSLIFDEVKGDIIRGRGRGNLKISYTRQGDFEMFGNYEIEQGEYLFTVALLPVAKPFAVERGGRITWTGDPVNATLDITANYQTRTPVRPFIEEYLTIANENTKSLASQRSEVDLKLRLRGSLFEPQISFDLSFPNLVSDLSTLTDSKLRILRNNELELNSQVLGLIVFNSFLPSNRVADVFGAAGLQSAGINTLSEFLSSQLSLYITNLLNSALEENGLISGIDFEVGVRNNNLALGAANRNNLFPDEIEIRMKNKFRFMDERFSVNIGGNYVFQNQGIAINQVLPDFALEFLLTEDRKLKVRLYGKYDIDPIAITSLREKYGLGMAYRTEFGSMVNFEKSVKTKVTEMLKQK